MIKKIAITLLFVTISMFAVSHVASAQTVNNLWKSLGGVIEPTFSASQLKVPSLGGSGIKCLQTDNNGQISAAVGACGTGGGGGSGTFSTTTVAGREFQYPTNASITSLDATATSTAGNFTGWWYDPFTNQQVINASTTIASLTTGTVTATSTTATSTFAGGLIVDSNTFVVDYSSDKVGIGTTTALQKLSIDMEAQLNTRESIMRAGVSDAGNDAFYIGNGTVTAKQFLPVFGGYVESRNTAYSLGFEGLVRDTDDASDSSNFGLIDFMSARTDTAINPINGATSVVQNRKLFTFRNNGVFTLVGLANGNWGIGSSTPGTALGVNGAGVFNDQVRAPYFYGTSTTATSTFSGGVQTTAINVTSATASSTFANGLNLTGGCFAINGTCVSGSGGSGSGTVNSGLAGQTAYYASAGTAVSGTSTIFMTPAGNVGVGTTSPRAFFHVAGDLSIIPNGTGNANFSVQSGDNAGNWSFTTQATDGKFTFYDVKNNRNIVYLEPNGIVNTLYLAINGKTGHNTGSPQAAVHILQPFSAPGFFDPLYDPAQSQSYPLLLQNNFATNASSTGIGFTVTNANNNVGGAIVFKRTGTNSMGELQFLNKQNVTGSGQLTTSMLISDTGNVGIGTTSPYAKLSVVGQTVAEYFTGTSTTATSTFGGGARSTIFNATSATASSTFANGINLTSGCFSINGTCVSGSGGSGNVTGTGVAGYLSAWTSSTNLVATGSPTVGYVMATSTTAASTFPYASTTQLTTSGTLELPNGTAPTLNHVAQLAFDTTSGNLVVATSTVGSFVAASATTTLYSFTASTSPITSGTNIDMPSHPLAQAATALWCKVSSGTSIQINLSDGTNDTNTITCTTTGTQYALTGSNTWNAYEAIRMEFGTKTGDTGYLTVRVLGYRTTD